MTIPYCYKLCALFEECVLEYPDIVVTDNISGIYDYLTTRNVGLVGGVFSGGVLSGSSSS